MKSTLAIFLLFTTPVFAQIHGGDVELTVGDNKLATDTKVYAAEFGDTGIPNEINEPGFDNLVGTFAVGSSIGFSILDSLRKWNGIDFDTIPAETISVSFGTSLGPITTATTPAVVDGFDLNVASDGSWHRHYDFLLNSPASTGIYLLQMQLHSSDPGIVATDPFFIVFNQNDTELDHDAAISFVEASVVPDASTGDLNDDQAVDAADAGIMFGNWGSFGVGDLNNDDIVDAADAGIMFANWTGDTAPVPEPASSVILVIGLCGLLVARKRENA